jgi:hypothetical protein
LKAWGVRIACSKIYALLFWVHLDSSWSLFLQFVVIGATHGHLCFKRPSHVIWMTVELTRVLKGLELPKLSSTQVPFSRASLPLLIVCCSCRPRDASCSRAFFFSFFTSHFSSNHSFRGRLRVRSATFQNAAFIPAYLSSNKSSGPVLKHPIVKRYCLAMPPFFS